MCGIFGFVVNAPSATEKSLIDLKKGMSRIAHRGPDGQGTWVSDNGQVGLGHVRLSIIALATGSQPMPSSDDRYIITFNGEIYNYIELRDEIGVAGFKTSSDTEVILKAYELWGAGCVNKLRGMFAFAIWDKHAETLFIARDRFGIKPFYWTKTHQGFYFSSEVKALMPFLSSRGVNHSALSDYFTFQFCLGKKTLVEGVSQLPAAHYGYYNARDGFHSQKYWEVQYDIDYEHSERWFTHRLRELLNESVDLHLRADVEVGAYVSGGLDSSLLAALAREKRCAGDFKIFNGRFLESSAFDESNYARDLATENDMDIFIADITEDDFVDHFEKVIWHLDQPNAGPGSFPQYMVSREVSKNVKVVLGGQGGDEIFGGYARYLVAYFEQCIKGAIEGTLNNGNYVVTYESIIPNLKTLRQYKPLIREFWSDGLFGERDDRYLRLVNRSNTFSDIIAEEFLNSEHTRDEFKTIFWGDNVGQESYFDSMTHFDFKTLLPALLQVEDRMSMAHGVEARVPFLDHPLIEFAATIPADVKFKDGELKRLLKTTFSSYLPNSINNRKDKMGFPVPINNWLNQKGKARDMVRDILSSQSAKTRYYLNPGFDFDNMLEVQGTYSRNLWALLSLEVWHRQFID